MKTATDNPPPTASKEERYRARAFEASKRAADLEKKLEQAEAKLAKAERTFDEAPLKVENDRLKGELRSRNHRDAFRKAAVTSGFDPDGVDDLYTLSGWKAEKDDIDEKALGDLVETLKTSKPRFLKPTESDTTVETPAAPEVKRVPAADRGTSHDKGKSGIRLTAQHLADPKFMLDPKNKDMILAAAKEGRIALPMREAQ